MLTVENTFKDYPDIVSFDQMREMLHIGRNKAYSLIKQKKIRSIRIGRRHKIPKINLIEFLNQDSYNNN